MKLHPDKNSHPKATDAFKKVSAAFACLSDAEKKNVYDQCGGEENQFEQEYERRGHRHHHHEQEFDPFDIFDAFFGLSLIHI